MNRVLLIDDDPEVVSILTMMLEGSFDVVGYTDPNQALAQMGACTFDCLVADILMPGLDGFSLILKARRMRPGLPVVLISGLLDEDDAMSQEIVRRYTDCMVSKPVRREDLLAAVGRACGGTV